MTPLDQLNGAIDALLLHHPRDVSEAAAMIGAVREAERRLIDLRGDFRDQWSAMVEADLDAVSFEGCAFTQAFASLIDMQTGELR